MPSPDFAATGRLEESLRKSSTIDEATQVLHEVTALEARQQLHAKTGLDLRRSAIMILRELTAESPGEAVTLIVNELVPLCVSGRSVQPEDNVYATYVFREMLADWLTQYPGDNGRVVRRSVLDALKSILSSADLEGACWTIAVVGYRREDVVENLWDIVRRRDDEVGDVALATLTSLGVPRDDQARVLQALHERVARRDNVALLGALRRMADPSSIEYLLRHWLIPDATGNLPDRARHYIRVLADVADEHVDDPELQDRIWPSLQKLLVDQSDALDSALYLGNDVVPRVNAPGVIDFLIASFDQDETNERAAANRRYLLALRLTDCVRPRQLARWSELRYDEIRDVLRVQVCKDTADEGRSLTEEGTHKETAWGILLRLGDPYILTSDAFTHCVAGESNPYLRAHACESLACFRLDPLPPTLIAWVMDPHNQARIASDNELPWRSAAIEIVGNAPSRRSFDALRGFGFRIEDQVLQRSVDAISDQAYLLTRAGNEWPEDLLFESALQGPHLWHRSAAIEAIKDLATQELLSERRRGALLHLLDDADLPSFVRADVAETLGMLCVSHPSVREIKRLWVLARQQDDDVLRWGCLTALALLGTLAEDHDLLTSVLHLRLRAGSWRVLDNARLSASWVTVVGILYRENPRSFASAIATALSRGDWRVADQAARVVRAAQRRPSAVPVPRNVRTALLNCLEQDSIFGPPPESVVEVVADLLPDALATPVGMRRVERWPADTIASFAENVGRTRPLKPAALKRVTLLFLHLTNDPRYRVRRAGCQALARLTSATLESSCKLWMQSATPEERVKAAEASSWTRADLVSDLRTDAEPTVRKAAERAMQQRRARGWAEEYLTQLESIGGQSNQEILDIWAYGEALVRIGDDECIHNLEKLQALSRLPHGNYLLHRIRTGIQKRWDVVVRDWDKSDTTVN
jgi:hypothetical protein